MMPRGWERGGWKRWAGGMGGRGKSRRHSLENYRINFCDEKQFLWRSDKFFTKHFLLWLYSFCDETTIFAKIFLLWLQFLWRDKNLCEDFFIVTVQFLWRDSNLCEDFFYCDWTVFVTKQRFLRGRFLCGETVSDETTICNRCSDISWQHSLFLSSLNGMLIQFYY
jgi:hypothetical protein